MLVSKSGQQGALCTRKYQLAGQLAGTVFFNTRAARHTKKFHFSPKANLGGFGLLRNVGKSVFEIMGQAGVFPAMYPNCAKMALGWPTGGDHTLHLSMKPCRPQKYPFVL